MRRGTAVVLTLAIAVAAAAGGWLAGRNIKSPDQAALESEPPAASLITVDVELTELVADVIIRADVGYDEPASLSLSGALGNRESVLVVTSAPERGAELTEGSVAIEIAGQPVFVLAGPVPAYRDLRPQDSGPDVGQLEAALVRLGHFEGDPDQLWDEATSLAVRAWYEQAGYRANGPSDTEQAALEAARDRLDRARDTLVDAQGALADAGEAPTELAVQQARTGVASAELALDQARRDLSQVISDARQAVTDALQALADAGLNLAAAELARDRAAGDYTQAELRMQSALDGVHPDSGAVPSASEHEALRAAATDAENALAAADRAVKDAERAITDATWAVTDAQEQLKEAQADLQADGQDSQSETDPQSTQDPEETGGVQSTQDPEETGGVEAAEDSQGSRTGTGSSDERARPETQAQLAARSAEDRLAAAEQALEDLLAPPDTADALRRLNSARAELSDAEADLAELEATTGVWLPAGELIFLKRLPVRVDLLTAERGSTVAGSFMTVTGSELAVRGSISERDVDRVTEDMSVRIEDRSLEAPIQGTIRLLDRRAGTRGLAPDRHYVEIVAQGIPDRLVGRNVKIVIPVGGTDGPVLVVPNAALSATASGLTRVEVEQPDGTTRFVTVEPGLSTGGRAEVTPVDGELRAGDRVVVGVASGE
ncbi:MAG: hypothetical protein OXN44_06135 [Acidimicrobiaceae bacterium]|nr:hypothetical protein [Acidimicrobiaceae bacterium]MDE0605631.1 hypothetical protein [Acidimicrobiaceae bacterium]